MKDVWDTRISVKENMASMGVALSAKELLPHISSKKQMVNNLKKRRKIEVTLPQEAKVTKPEVIEQLEAEANVEARQNFRFTPTQVQLITYMMDKHGMDFKAMARDAKNHYQETPAKLKGMVTKFINIPEHYAPYCKSRGLMPVAENDQPEIVGSESESDEADEQDDSIDVTGDLE